MIACVVVERTCTHKLALFKFEYLRCDFCIEFHAKQSNKIMLPIFDILQIITIQLCIDRFSFARNFILLSFSCDDEHPNRINFFCTQLNFSFFVNYKCVVCSSFFQMWSTNLFVQKRIEGESKINTIKYSFFVHGLLRPKGCCWCCSHAQRRRYAQLIPRSLPECACHTIMALMEQQNFPKFVVLLQHFLKQGIFPFSSFLTAIKSGEAQWLFSGFWVARAAPKNRNIVFIKSRANCGAIKSCSTTKLEDLTIKHRRCHKCFATVPMQLPNLQS